MQRRSFLAGMLAACAAPAIVRADSLMRVVTPSFADGLPILWGDGMHDDAPALQSLLDGHRVSRSSGGVLVAERIGVGQYRVNIPRGVYDIHKTLELKPGAHIDGHGSFFRGKGPMPLFYVRNNHARNAG